MLRSNGAEKIVNNSEIKTGVYVEVAREAKMSVLGAVAAAGVIERGVKRAAGLSKFSSS